MDASDLGNVNTNTWKPIAKIACALVLCCAFVSTSYDTPIATAMVEMVISSNVGPQEGDERYSKPTFGIGSIVFPQGWAEAESNTVKGISVYLRLVRSTGFSEIGATDLSAISLTAIKNSSTSISLEDNKSTSFPDELLQHDDQDCRLLDKSSSIINQHSFEIFGVRCNTFQYKTYNTIANDTKISLTYSALTEAFPLHVKEFDESAQTLKVSSES